MADLGGAISRSRRCWRFSAHERERPSRGRSNSTEPYLIEGLIKPRPKRHGEECLTLQEAIASRVEYFPRRQATEQPRQTEVGADDLWNTGGIHCEAFLARDGRVTPPRATLGASLSVFAVLGLMQPNSLDGQVDR
jgi:hypothetical protein